MARFARLAVYQAIHETGLVPVFYHPELEVVVEVARACAAGGARLFEYTNRGDRAWQVFSELERICALELPQMIAGGGSIIEPYTAALFVNNGANFIVGPSLNPDLARFCNRRKIAYSPGCATASEISQAEELGVEIVKIFPGETIGGPQFVRSIRGPSPWSSLMPTGGINLSPGSLGEWFKAGICAAGIGGTLITPELVAAGDWAGIAEKIRQTLATIRDVRAKM